MMLDWSGSPTFIYSSLVTVKSINGVTVYLSWEDLKQKKKMLANKVQCEWFVGNMLHTYKHNTQVILSMVI